VPLRLKIGDHIRVAVPTERGEEEVLFTILEVARVPYRRGIYRYRIAYKLQHFGFTSPTAYIFVRSEREAMDKFARIAEEYLKNRLLVRLAAR